MLADQQQPVDVPLAEPDRRGIGAPPPRYGRVPPRYGRVPPRYGRVPPRYGRVAAASAR